LQENNEITELIIRDGMNYSNLTNDNIKTLANDSTIVVVFKGETSPAFTEEKKFDDVKASVKRQRDIEYNNMVLFDDEKKRKSFVATNCLECAKFQ